jgi:DNA-binding response OmpR family regulator
MARKKILIAEDDMDLQEGLNFLFSSQGYDVTTASDGISAVNIAQTEDPDLIILDLSLPWVDGYKVMERLGSSTSLPHIPIVILTGRDASINRERTIKAGVDAFFHKPFDNIQLLATVESILKDKPSENTSGRFDKGNILIVDDDKDFLEGLDFLLSSNGYHVITAMDGTSLFNMAHKEKPDAIILDLSLPGVNGYYVMERLKSVTFFANIPIIILTGMNASVNKKRSLTAGAAAFFEKPFDHVELLTAIENAVKKSNQPKMDGA